MSHMLLGYHTRVPHARIVQPEHHRDGHVFSDRIRIVANISHDPQETAAFGLIEANRWPAAI